jgi:hypothetical protein
MKPQFGPGGQVGEHGEEVDVVAGDAASVRVAALLRGILIVLMLVSVLLVGLGVKSFMDTRQFLGIAQPCNGRGGQGHDVLHYFPAVIEPTDADLN